MIDKWFSDIGKKIVSLSTILFGIGVFISFCYGLSWIGRIPEPVIPGMHFIIQYFLGFVVMLLGSAVSYVLSWGMYAFGELIDNTTQIAEEIKKASTTK